jgi:NADH:ubiquinone oxidoreductase subunit F (NADH-binding)/NADH:ubiquinone oxidoreductase subunit E
VRAINLIQELYALQRSRGHLRDEDLRSLAQRARAPLHELQGIVSYYPHFRRSEPAALEIGVCRDLPCHLRGSRRVRERLEQQCQGRSDVVVEPVSCLGRCDRAPCCYGRDRPLSPEQAEALIRGRSDEVAAELAPSRGRYQADPHASSEDRYGVLRELASSGDFSGAISRIQASGLLGMGGAGFPTGRKWALVREQAATPKYVVCNADESEVGAFKDRAILAELPHLVIEGLAIAALCVGAEEGWIFIRHEYAPECAILRRAIADAYRRGVLGEDVCGSGHRLELQVFVSPGGYVLGEESALLEALEGRRGEPRIRPPFPGVAGLWGKPTLINNVETLAHVPRILRCGRADRKFFSVSGDVARPGVHEVPLGTTLRELVELCGGMREGRPLFAFLPGGASTGFLGAEHEHVPMLWGPLQEAGSAMGSGAVVVLAEGVDLLEAGRNLTAFFHNESCGKCVPCRVGTEKAIALVDAQGRDGLLLLSELADALRETSLCGLGQVALTPLISVLERFPSDAEGSGP